MRKLMLISISLLFLGVGCGENVDWAGKEEAATQACINQGGVPLFRGSGGSMTDCKFK